MLDDISKTLEELSAKKEMYAKFHQHSTRDFPKKRLSIGSRSIYLKFCIPELLSFVLKVILCTRKSRFPGIKQNLQSDLSIDGVLDLHGSLKFLERAECMMFGDYSTDRGFEGEAILACLRFIRDVQRQMGDKNFAVLESLLTGNTFGISRQVLLFLHSLFNADEPATEKQVGYFADGRRLDSFAGFLEDTPVTSNKLLLLYHVSEAVMSAYLQSHANIYPEAKLSRHTAAKRLRCSSTVNDGRLWKEFHTELALELAKPTFEHEKRRQATTKAIFG